MHQLVNHDSWETRKLIWGYDSFLESLKTVADMGCGQGGDIEWFATLESKDEPPEPYNYKCYAVDIDQQKLDKIANHKNIFKINRDFTERQILPVSIDLMWAHDSLQYSTNPLETLKFWNEQMTTNGMLCLHVSQTSGVINNRYQSHTPSGCFYNHTPLSLIYMLAVNGFDCCDAYLLKKWQNPWVKLAVYKSNIEPMDPKKTSWYDLCDAGLLHPSIVESVNRRGFPKQEEIVMSWLDRENYYIDWVQPATEIPDVPVTNNGVRNTTKSGTSNKIKSNKPKEVTQETLKPVGIQRAPKQRFVK